MRTSIVKTKNTSQMVDLDYNPGGYFWTHGYKVHFWRISRNCKNNREVHINESPILDIKVIIELNNNWKAAST